MQGQLVRILDIAPGGQAGARWRGDLENGGRAPAGAYLARLAPGGRALRILRLR
jgi:hypothetical protein